MSHSGDRSGLPPGSDHRFEEPTPLEVLLGEIDVIIGEWRDLVRAEPWTRIPAARLVDALPEILPRLIRLAQTGATHLDDELGAHISNAHGFFRRQDALPLLAVAEEWSFLKRACQAVLLRHGFVDGDVTAAMQRLETLIDDAIGYTLRGYYRSELDVLRGRGLERRDSGLRDRSAGPRDRRADPD